VPDPHLMEDELAELHGRCGQRFAALVAGVGLGQWQNGTVCSQWDVRALVDHLLYEQRWVPPLFEGLTIEQAGDRFEGDLMGEDVSAWPGLLASSIEQAHAAVAEPGALDRTVHLSFGDASGEEYVTQLTADLAITPGTSPGPPARTTRSTPAPSRCCFPGPKPTPACWQRRACSAHESTLGPTRRMTSAC
jgi:hypothetical protein